MKQNLRQKTRKAILLVMFALFPIIYYYFSPYLIIIGASEGVVAGSFITFSAMLVGSLFLGRFFCGWICPAGATQELCFKVNNKDFKGGKRNWIKYFIWAPWIAIIAVMFVQAGGVSAVDPFYQTYYGILIQDIQSVMLFLAIAGLFAGIALAAGKRASCHTICWMAPFMIIGRKIRNAINLPALQLVADRNECINCKTCTRNCPMSLDVNSMVQKDSMENSECVLCGTCADNCPKNAIKLSFGTKKQAEKA
jgi:ferredoxin-type protein NapH